MNLQEKTIENTLAFMLEYQRLVLSGSNFSNTLLIKRYKAPTGTVGIMKKLCLTNYELITNNSPKNKTVRKALFTKEDAMNVLKEVSSEQAEYYKKRKNKSNTNTMNTDISAGDLFKVKVFIEDINKQATARVISSNLLLNVIKYNNFNVDILQCLIEQKVISFQNQIDSTVFYRVNLIDPTSITCRNLWTAFLKYYFDKSKSNLEKQIQVKETKTENTMDKKVDKSTEEKTVKLSIEKAKALYLAFPEMRFTVLSELTDNELGIDTFPKTWDEVESRLKELDVDCHVIESNVLYISEKHAQQADAQNKLQWIAYYLNLNTEVETNLYWTYYDYASDSIEIEKDNANNKFTNELVFNSKKDLERSLVEYEDLWNKYYMI